MNNTNNLSLRQRLFRWLKANKGKWVPFLELADLSKKAGYSPTTSAREIHSLFLANRIEMKGKGKQAEFRWTFEYDFPGRMLQEIKEFDAMECQCRAPLQCTRH